MNYRWVIPDLDLFPLDVSPYLIHTLEHVGRLTKAERQKAIEEAGYNTFLLRSADVTIDLLTDSGTTAMSTDQWAAYEAARPSSSTSEEYENLVAVLQDTFGYEYILPTHQGRAAEHILSQICIKPGQIVPGNMYFTTTKLHQEMAGGVFADVIVDEAHDPTSEFRWKGNIDLKKLDKLVEEHGAEKIAYVSFEHSVNMAGGQPVSMDNMKQVHAYCTERGIPIFFDATRVAENAVMIQMHDPHYHQTPVKDILGEMMLYGDGCTVSGKKDFLINIGGLLAFRDSAELRLEGPGDAPRLRGQRDGRWTARRRPRRDRRGRRGDGGRPLHPHRVKATAFLGELLHAAGVPVVRPSGSHAIFLDAKRFLPHVDQDEFPAQRLAAEIFVETGVRTDGARQRLQGPQSGDGRELPSGARAGPPHDPAPRLHQGPPARRGRGDHPALRPPRRNPGPASTSTSRQKLRFFQSRFEPLEKTVVGA